MFATFQHDNAILLSLATSGDATQMEMFLFVSRHPKVAKASKVELQRESQLPATLLLLLQLLLQLMQRQKSTQLLLSITCKVSHSELRRINIKVK
jgi:hypothetical protein